MNEDVYWHGLSDCARFRCLGTIVHQRPQEEAGQCRYEIVRKCDAANDPPGVIME